MSLNRRQLVLGGLELLLSASALRSLSAFAASPSVGDPKEVAAEPWREWLAQTYSGPLRIVEAATLAANPHDTQP